jgi:branched-chain amino acid transport system permease protein
VTLGQLEKAAPMVFLFALLIFIPAARLRTSSAAGRAAPTVPGATQTWAFAGGLFVLALVLAPTLSLSNLAVGTRAAILGLTLLSLVLLTGYSGQTSLCHLSFVGLGAFAMGSWSSGTVLGLVWAMLLAAACGAAIAIFTARLRGLYLALATFAFAKALDESFFPHHLGSGGQLEVRRFDLPGISTTSDATYFVVCVAIFCLASVGVLAVRRGRWGRQLTALNDSPAACATLGVNTRNTKIVVFAASAGLAGLSGALYGGQQGLVGPLDFTVLGSLALLLALRIGGVNTVTGAAFGALTTALFPLMQDRIDNPRIQLAYLLTGLAAISVGRDPDGVGGQISKAGAALRARFGRASGPRPSAPAAEEASLVRS